MDDNTAPFDPLEGCTTDTYEPDLRWLYERLHYNVADGGDFHDYISDRDRAVEVLEFSLSNPSLRGWRRYVAAELAVDSVVDLIEPEIGDGYEPVPDEVAEPLLRKILADPVTRHHLKGYVRSDMREAGYYKRLAALVDRLLAE